MEPEIRQTVTNFLFKRHKFGPASLRSIATEVKISPKTLKKHIQELVDKKYLYEENEGKWKSYGLTDNTFNYMKDMVAYEDIDFEKRVRVGISAGQNIIRVPTELSYALGAKSDAIIDFVFKAKAVDINKNRIEGAFVLEVVEKDSIKLEDDEEMEDNVQ